MVRNNSNSMKMLTKKITLYILTCTLVLQLPAQVPVLDSIQKQFDAYSKNILQEKIYLHSDKEVYLAGEVFWFKLYDVDALFLKPAAISQVGYAEVLDSKNKPVLQAKISLQKGVGYGTWDLPQNLPSGIYTVRAYTNWMKNFNPAYFFKKQITIINARSQNTEDTLPKKENYTVGFYPEGGNMVNGIQSKVAFHVVDKTGSGVPFEAVLMNGSGDSVLKFQPGKFGIGNFLFTPKAGQTYQAILKFPNGQTITRSLPASFNDGWVMQLDRSSGNQVKIIVKASANQAGLPVYLFVHSRKATQLALSSNFQNGQAIFLVDKTILGDGISCFTVFNRDRKPVCERLYFTLPKKLMALDIQSNSAVYGRREKVNFQIASADQIGKPVQANMSMSVFLLDSLQVNNNVDISQYFWLSSDLAGAVESPSYYFNKGGNTGDDADNLMLTHGWRRFRWEEIGKNGKPAFEYIPEYAGHVVTGKVTEISTGKPAAGINCYLTVTGSQTQFRVAESDSAGRIAFELGKFYNDGEVIIQTNSRLDSLYSIEIFKPFSEKYGENTGSLFSVPGAYAETIASRFSNYQVQHTYTGNSQLRYLFPKADTSAFYFKPDISYQLDNYVRFTTMEEVLREFVEPVNVRKRDGEFRLHVVDKNRNVFFESDPLVLLDGLPVFDINKLMAYDPLKVRRLDVVSRGYYLGSQSFTGIVNFITYSTNLQDFELDPHATVLDYDGLQLQREFFAPEYLTGQQKANRLPDFRNLLYWNPAINTNDTGKQEVYFYSSDLPGKYIVVLQGIGEGGLPGSAVRYIEVK